MNNTAIHFASVALLAFAQFAHGMASEQIGPDKPDRPTVAQPGWPKGIEELLRHPSRVYSIWVNGNENFYFKATPQQINELLEKFSKARLRDHEVKLEKGSPKITSLNKQEFEYNVSLLILSGIALFMERQTNDNQTLEPALTISVDEEGKLLKELKLPENVIVTSAPESSQINTGKLPKREAWYGRVQFDSDDVAGAMERGVSTRITLWQKDLDSGIELADVSRDGIFKVILSNEEVAAMQQVDLWLTVTVGNWIKAARKDDAKFPVEMLNQDRQKAQPLKIAGPKYYYGRILFEDGSPAVLNPKPWPGAEVAVDFSYAGMARPDSDGYFRVCLDPEQFEKLIKQKPRKNIYIPDAEKGRATAREIFPAKLLSQDKAKAGIVRIHKPMYGPLSLGASDAKGFLSTRLERIALQLVCCID